MSRRPALAALALLVVAAAPLASPAAGATSVAGIPAKLVGRHGPTAHYAQGLNLIGHTDLARRKGGPALGNNGGIALIGNCAFVGRWHDYGDFRRNPGTVQYPIQIVDVAKPSAPRVVGSVPNSNLLNAAAREIRAVDLPKFKMLVVQMFGKYLDEGATAPGQHSLYFYTFPSGRCTEPVLTGRIDLKPLRPHEFYLWLDPDPAHNVDGNPRVIAYVTAPLSGVDGAIVDASKPAAPVLLGIWHGGQPLASATEENLAGDVPAGAGRYSHSIALSPDGRRAYVSQWDGGFLTLDASAIADAQPRATLGPLGAMSVPYLYETGAVGNTHSAVPMRGGETMVVGDEVYVTTDGCPYGWMRVIDAGNQTAPPAQIGEFRLRENRADACSGVLSASRNALGKSIDGTFSMHNQTATSRYALVSWYGGGLRVVDLANPAKPRQTAFFVPKPPAKVLSVPDTSAPIFGATEDTSDDWWVSTWSYPIVRKGLIYVADIRGGLYILRARPGTPLARDLARYKFLEGNSNLDMFVR
ncbi:MAG TPA: hypothetical protein VGB64_13500 [Actinomycetota bacterium]